MTESKAAPSPALEMLGRALPWMGAIAVLGATTYLGLRQGAASAVLWLAFAALCGALLLIAEALRAWMAPATVEELVSDVHATSDELTRWDTRKTEALRALKEIDFERSLGRMSDEDHALLRERYRAEAREAMQGIDRLLAGDLTHAERAVAALEHGTTGKSTAKKKHGKAHGADTRDAPEKDPAPAPAKPSATESKPATRPCPACETANDPDAVFCKRCGAKVDA